MRIFIASADSAFRLAVQLLIESEPGIVTIGMFDRSEGLASIVGSSHPEVLLLDYEITKQSTVGLISELFHLEAPPQIIVLSINSQVKEQVLAAGVNYFIDKTFPPDELLPILRRLRKPDVTH